MKRLSAENAADLPTILSADLSAEALAKVEALAEEEALTKDGGIFRHLVKIFSLL